MKIVAISDTHSRHNAIKDFHETNSLGEEKEPLGGDIIIHAGDATNNGSFNDTNNFLQWFSGLDFKHHIFVAGNHDWLFEKSKQLAYEMCEQYGITYLEDSGVEIDGIKIYGSPVQPRFLNWAFNKDRGDDIKKHWDMIPMDTDILITHGGPYKILDLAPVNVINSEPVHVGCNDLLNRIKEVKPRLHIFGHIHNSHGEHHEDETIFYNVAICDEQYRPLNPVRVINYEP